MEKVPSGKKEQASSRRDFLGSLGIAGVAIAAGYGGSVAERKIVDFKVKSGEEVKPTPKTFEEKQDDIIKGFLESSDSETYKRVSAYIQRCSEDVRLLILQSSNRKHELLEPGLTEGVKAVIRIDLYQIEERLKFLQSHIDFYSELVKNAMEDESSRKKSKQIIKKIG